MTDELAKRNEDTRVRAMLEGMAITYEREEVEKLRADHLAEYRAIHEKDVAGFAFDCSIWGSFLRVSIVRGLVDRNYGAAPNLDFSTALYLPNVRTVTLTEGNAPDEGGVVEYSQTDKNGSSGVWSNSRHPLLTFAVDYQIRPCFQRHTFRQLFYEVPKPTEGGNRNQAMGVGYGGQHGDLNYKTTGFPRAAADDQIVFNSLGVTFYTPGGCGKEFYEAILSATKSKGLRSPPTKVKSEE